MAEIIIMVVATFIIIGLTAAAILGAPSWVFLIAVLIGALGIFACFIISWAMGVTLE